MMERNNKVGILNIFKSLLSCVLIICFLVFIYQISSLYKYREENRQLKILVDKYSKLEKDIADYEKTRNYYVLTSGGDGSLKSLEEKINDLKEEKSNLEKKINDIDTKIKIISYGRLCPQPNKRKINKKSKPPLEIVC